VVAVALAFADCSLRVQFVYRTFGVLVCWLLYKCHGTSVLADRETVAFNCAFVLAILTCTRYKRQTLFIVSKLECWNSWTWPTDSGNARREPVLYWTVRYLQITGKSFPVNVSLIVLLPCQYTCYYSCLWEEVVSNSDGRFDWETLLRTMESISRDVMINCASTFVRQQN